MKTKNQIKNFSKKIISNFTLFAISCCALLTCCNDDKTPTTPVEATAEVTFMNNASISNLAEVDLGTLTLNKGQDTAVKNFAQMMVAEHTLAQGELKTLATQKSVTIPNTVDAANKACKDRISTYTGAQYDTAYIHTQILAHQKAITLFQLGTQSADMDVKNYASKYLPKIQMHLELANTVAAKLPLK